MKKVAYAVAGFQVMYKRKGCYHPRKTTKTINAIRFCADCGEEQTDEEEA